MDMPGAEGCSELLGGWAGVGTPGVTAGTVCHHTEPGWSSEIPRAGYHRFLLAQECRSWARAGCHHPAGRGSPAVGSVVPGLEPRLPPEKEPPALPFPLGVTGWHRGQRLDPGRNEEHDVPEGGSRIIYSPKMKAGMQEGFGRCRAAPVLGSAWALGPFSSRGWGEALGLWGLSARGNCWLTAARSLSSLP